ncbi:MAG: hypothetical protein ACHWZW_07770 [Spirulina sp.]
MALPNPLQPWLNEHPLLAWFLGHPLWLFGAVAVGLIVLVGLGSTLARLTEALGVQIVRFPVALGGRIVATVTQALLHPWKTRHSGVDSEDQLDAILERLDALHHEQEALLKELHQRLAQRPKFPKQP